MSEDAQVTPDDPGKQDVGSNSLAKRFVTKLLLVDKVQNRWAKSLIGTLSTTVIISLLGLTATTLYQEVQQILSEAYNISEEEALSVARQNLGANTVEAIPFRNKDSEQQYIAVSTKMPEGEERTLGCFGPIWEIRLLEGTEGMYHEIPNLGMHACDFSTVPDTGNEGEPVPEKYKRRLFDVLDIDDDGNKEIYSMVREGGAGSGYRFRVNVYDSLDNRLYWLSAQGEFSSPMLNYDYSSSLTQNREVSGWTQEKARDLTFNKPADQTTTPDDETLLYEKAVEDWLQRNGRGFYEGKVEVQEFQGHIPPSGGSIACTVSDVGDESVWVAYFKGALLGYDGSENTHFVVWVPYSEYDWVNTMVSGERYLWLGVGTDEGILAFDKETRSLKIIPVPEAPRLFFGSSSTSGTPQLSALRAGDLRVFGSSLYVSQWGADDILLTLPDSVNTRDEFENAASCIAS